MGRLIYSGFEKRSEIVDVFRFYFMALLRSFDDQVMAHVFHDIQCVVGKKRWNDVVIFSIDTKDG